MSGGILLPGTAQPSDVASGKTFSGAAGFNLTGTKVTPLVLPSPTEFLPIGGGGLPAQIFQQSVSSLVVIRKGVVANNPLVAVGYGMGGGTVSGVSGGGATWTKLQSTTHNRDVTLWIGIGTTGGDIAITFTWSASDTITGQLFELFNSANPSSPVVASAVDDGTLTISQTAAAVNHALMHFISDDGASVPGSTAGFTMERLYNQWSSNYYHGVAWQVAQDTSAHSVTWGGSAGPGAVTLELQ